MKFYFICGSQHLYGEETLMQVANNAKTMVDGLNESGTLPFEVELLPTVKTEKEIAEAMEKANADSECLGVITFMHTFSPSKMWIKGFNLINKPVCHFHTQFGREIPWDTIDMDFMNLYQSAHGDREHGFILSRLRKAHKIVVGYWEEADVQKDLADYMRTAYGVYVSKKLKVARFGDNMRNVAVTEGDKVETQIKLGWNVDYFGIGDLVEYVTAVSEDEVERVYSEVTTKYTLATDNTDSVKYQVRLFIAMDKFLSEGGYKAFTTNFEDLHGLKQLPGLASQLLMAKGYGFGGEGDWKTAAMTHIMKAMTEDLTGGTSFMEDYTYHMPTGSEMILGAHMLEVCPTIASETPKILVKPLGIGGKDDPARLTFNGKDGDAICVSLIDMGGRLRLISADVNAVAPLKAMPNLPVAGVMWKPLPDFKTGVSAWLVCGGAHHTVLSYDLNSSQMNDFAEMMGIEFVHIGEGTDLVNLKKELLYNDLAYKLK